MSPVTWALNAAADVVLAVAAALIVTVVTLALADAAWHAWDRHKAARGNRYRAAVLGDDIITALCRPCWGDPGPCTCTVACAHPWCARRERTATDEELARLLYEGENS